MPEPICPMGIVSTETPDPAEPPSPGTSQLDGQLQRVRELLQSEEGGEA
jgi:hypothetical protein